MGIIKWNAKLKVSLHTADVFTTDSLDRYTMVVVAIRLCQCLWRCSYQTLPALVGLPTKLWFCFSRYAYQTSAISPMKRKKLFQLMMAFIVLCEKCFLCNLVSFGCSRFLTVKNLIKLKKTK